MPEVAFAHPLEGGRAAAVFSSVEDTAATLGEDETRYRRLFGPLARDLDKLLPTVLAPLGRSVPAHPLAMARFGAIGLLRRPGWPGGSAPTRGGPSSPAPPPHSMLPLSAPLTASFGLLFVAVAHGLGWPVVAGGSERIVGPSSPSWSRSVARSRPAAGSSGWSDLPPARTTLLDVSPRQFLDLAGDRLEPAVPAGARAVPLRARGVQGRLGALGPGPVAGRGVPAGRDRARVRSARRGRTLARPPCGGPARRPAVLLDRPAGRGRPDPRSRRPADPVGLLPRAGGLHHRHDAADRGPDRAVRAGVSASASSPARP